MANALGVDRKLLSAVTTGTVTFRPRAGARPQQGYYNFVSWATGVTSGVVKIEVAYDTTDAAYTGTWATVATVTNDASGNAYQDYVYIPGQPKSIRHRISTTVAGGAAPSVTTYITGVN